jgi:DNA-directed RNA polymerase specialized sigma24 family protein
MTEKELPAIMSSILYNSEGKDDLLQEGLLGMWESLRNQGFF